MKATVAFLVLVFFMIMSTASAAVWYVAKDSLIETGTSWPTAFKTIQPAIDEAANGDEVWVAEGVYDEPRSALVGDSFENSGAIILNRNIRLYGGFTGSETQRAQRDWKTHVTTIDGSESRAGGHAYHVIMAYDGTTLDGFTIKGGRANGSSDTFFDRGAGVFIRLGAVTLANCTIIDNDASGTVSYGGGVFIENFGSVVKPVAIVDCAFADNNADYGGGVCAYNETASVTIERCTFANNTGFMGGGLAIALAAQATVSDCVFVQNEISGDGSSGGGLFVATLGAATIGGCEFLDNVADVGGGFRYDGSAALYIENCAFARNEGRWYGGAGHAYISAPGSSAFTNCTFFSNSSAASASGGGLDLAGGGPGNLKNCIFWANTPDQISAQGTATQVSYSDIEGGYSGAHNVDANPLFVDPASDDFRLSSVSPCLNVGTSTGAPDADIRGENRPQGGGVDIGAYERPGGAPTAAFTADLTLGASPLIVHFTDQSTPGTLPITARTWYFGDGTSSSEQDPTHTYAANNIFTVTLVVESDVDGDGATKPDYVATAVVITGQITQDGSGLSGVTIVMSGLTDKPVTDAQGVYRALVPYGWSGTVTPQRTGYTFASSSVSYSDVVVNQVDQNYLAQRAQGGGCAGGVLSDWNGPGPFRDATGDLVMMAALASVLALVSHRANRRAKAAVHP